MKYVFLVQHLHKLNECEDVKCIGIFSSEEKAKEVVKSLSKVNGFKDFPDQINPLIDEKEEGFYIDKYEIDNTYWKEGFSIV